MLLILQNKPLLVRPVALFLRCKSSPELKRYLHKQYFKSQFLVKKIQFISAKNFGNNLSEFDKIKDKFCIEIFMIYAIKLIQEFKFNALCKLIPV